MITPTPWKVLVNMATGEVRIQAADEGGCIVATMADNTDTKCNLDDAATIVQLVNHRAELMKALDTVTDELTQIRLMYNHTENSDPRGHEILQRAVDLYLKLSK
jgi:hypothetical protein